MGHPSRTRQAPLLNLDGRTVPATWVVDVATHTERPTAWYAKIYRHGYTYTVGWRPVHRAPGRAAMIWALRTLSDGQPVAFRGVDGVSAHEVRAVEQEVEGASPFAVLDLPSSRAVRRDLAVTLHYLEAECATHYTPPPLPPLDQSALATAAFSTLDLDEEVARLFADDSLAPRELEEIALRYVFEVLLGGPTPFLPHGEDPLKRLAVRRRQVERVATSYPFLARAAAEHLYDAWTDILGDIPWPVSSGNGVFAWELSCG